MAGIIMKYSRSKEVPMVWSALASMFASEFYKAQS